MYRLLMNLNKIISIKFLIIILLSNITFLKLSARKVQGQLASRKPLQAIASLNEIRQNATISNYIPNIRFIYYDS